MNERIRAPRVRVVTAQGEQLGVMETRKAVEKAKSLGLDLVEVAAKVNPPVCRIVDYGKYKYEQSKLKKKKAKSTARVKEVKFRVGTDTHDYNIKMGRAEKFLSEGHKVRFQLQFRGRENAHRDLGFEMLQRVAKDLEAMGKVDQQPRLAGRNLGMTLSPLPKDKQQRKFHLSHGELIDEDDDFDGEDDEDALPADSPPASSEEE